MAGSVVRLEFDKERKLKARHKFIRDAVNNSGKSIAQLVNDPFGGYPYILQALLQPGSRDTITLDKASELIDAYLDRHESIDGLTKGIIECLSGYLHIEVTPADSEEDEGNEATPATPGRGDDSPSISIARKGSRTRSVQTSG